MNTLLFLNLLLWVIVIPLALRGERTYQNLPELKSGKNAIPLSSLSIIIPARNEALILPKLLESLAQLTYPASYEIIVVDDNSQDETALIAESLGAKVVRLTWLPPGWLGKPHACQCGAEVATGEWLLFTDADTVHYPESAREAVSYAIHNNLDGLSLFIQQFTSGWADAVVLGTAFTSLFAGWGSMTNMFNGQYILVKSSVYFDSGGFASVRNAPVEDVPFGKRLQELGYRAPVLRGESLAEVHMYRNLTQLWHGLSRLGSGTLTRTPLSALFMIIFLAQLSSPLLYGVYAYRSLMIWILPFAAWGTVILMVIPWMHRIRSAGLALLAPLGAVFIIFAALWGVIQRLTGRGIHWKGRRV